MLCLGVAYVFRATYQGWFSYYLWLAMIFAPVLILLLSLPSMLMMKLQIEGRAFGLRGTRGTVKLSFSSALPFPVGQVRLFYEVENRFTQSITKGETLYRVCRSGRAVLPIPSAHCGQIVVRITRFECRDLFSFFALRRRCPPHFVCTILPRDREPQPSVDLDAVLNRNPEWKAKPGGGFSEEHDLRTYRPGDTGNSIHWKLSSKTDELIVREALELKNHDIYLVLCPEGDIDRSLEVICWLSKKLSTSELPHIIVSNECFSVEGDSMLPSVLKSILHEPLSQTASFDANHARCVLNVCNGKVSVH